ncbi:hypothetical protein KBC75_05455 [Candidatus Shapirobacteria bacterium]|nr:hypothetical protein [Candidatus Shapirobacteria bacterium]
MPQPQSLAEFALLYRVSNVILTPPFIKGVGVGETFKLNTPILGHRIEWEGDKITKVDFAKSIAIPLAQYSRMPQTRADTVRWELNESGTKSVSSTIIVDWVMRTSTKTAFGFFANTIY